MTSPVDRRAARARELELFEDQARRALAEHKAIAILVERTRRLLRRVVARRQRARLVERGDRDGVIAASDPPASITSAWPRRMISVASPIACALEAHAETWPMFGPLAPYFIAISPAAMSTIIIGIMNGETFRGSFACESTLSTSVPTPPMPEPNATPIVGACSGVISSLASFSA